MRELAEAQQRTDERLSETDERLNIFINHVERYIGERRNRHNGHERNHKRDETPPAP